MKKLNDLRVERADVVGQMETLANSETLNDEQRASWNSFDEKVKSIDAEIAMLERQEQLNLNNVKPMEINEQKPIGVQFREFLTNAMDHNGPTSFRVEPMLSTSNTDILNKTVAPVSELKTPGEAFLRSLGVTFYTGLNGQLVLPTKTEHSASFVAENNCAGDASMNITDIILAPRRITASQSVTREFLAQTNADIYQSLLDNLTGSLWVGVVADFFDVVDSDAATQIITTGTTATYADILQLEASLGCFSLNPMYITTPTGKAFFKGLDVGSDGIKYAWDGNEMNGYGAWATCAANANKVYFGDWANAVVGQWGGIEVIVDPYSYKKCGRVEVTVLGLFDSAVWNKQAFAILDASLA